MIKKKCFVGTASSGNPVLLIETYGGLFACFAKNSNGEIETLSTAPHRAIALFLAEKKDSKITWNETPIELSKSQSLNKANYFSNLLLKTNELNKGEKDLKAFYGAEIQPHHEEFVNWATKTLPRRNWQEWAVKNHAKDPKQFTEEAKSHINHYANSQHIPNIKAVRFDNHNVEQGIKAFKAAENQYNAKALQNPQLIKPSKGTTRFMDSSDGYSWNDHHKTSCTTIGKALGNCGNVGDENDTKTLLSLNRKVNIGGVEHHEPAILLSLGLDGKTIRQMKGRQNTIPSAQYHKHIINLLGNSDLIPESGGYDPGNDFHLDDLSHEEHDALIAKRPELGDYSSRVNVSAENQAKIIQSGDIGKIRALAKNPNLAPEHQATLVQSDDPEMLRNLAYNPNLAPEHQATLAKSNDGYVLWNLARNRNLAPEHQATLMLSKDPEVLHSLAYNRNLAPEHQVTLMDSSDPDVLRNLAMNPNLAPEHQATLAKSSDRIVLYNLAQNPNLAPEHQVKLAQSGDKFVLHSLSYNRNLAPEHQVTLMDSSDPDVLRNLAEDPNITPAAQAKLMQSDNPSVLDNLAQNPNLAPEHQVKLAQSGDKFVLHNLAKNPSLAPTVWKKMYSDTALKDKDLAEELRGRRSLVRLQAESNKNLANRKVRTAEYAKMKQTPIIKKSLSKAQSLNKANYFSNLLSKLANGDKITSMLPKLSIKEKKYRIYVGEQPITKPMTLKALTEKHGNLQQLKKYPAIRIVRHKQTVNEPTPPTGPIKKRLVKNDEEQANYFNELLKRILGQSHFIFSVEKPVYAAKVNTPNHEEAIKRLRAQGEKVIDAKGVYGGSPERSIVVVDPKNIAGLHQMAEDAGQEAVIYSNAGNHESRYINGDEKGQVKHGRGTAVYPEPPPDNYTTIEYEPGKLIHFSHDLTPIKVTKPEAFKKAQPNENIRQLADQYAKTKGLTLKHGLPPVKVNAERATRIAQAYHEMPHNPHEPQTNEAYKALIDETTDQFNHMKNTGLKISKIAPNSPSPYKTSQDLFNDIHRNNHMWYYPTDLGFGSGDKTLEHPMLQATNIIHEDKPMVANDLFRIVHDYFGHAKEGNAFGPNGEENAWQHHMQMYTPKAQKALTAETRGQNSWVNFGPNAKHNRANPTQTIYADQKAGLLPDWAMEKSEDNADDLEKASHNMREQRANVFGTTANPPANSAMRKKHIDHIKQWAKEFLNVELHPSGGKISPKTGQRRDKDPKIGVDKPDWRSGQLESQWNPEAIIHELAHLIVLPKGLGLKEGQTWMDKNFVRSNKLYGWQHGKYTQEEVQPMAAEQIIRRHLGLPASKVSVPVASKDAPPRVSAEDPSIVIGTRIQQGRTRQGESKYVDLIRQSRFLSPENKQRIEDVMTKKLVFHPEQGWVPNGKPTPIGKMTPNLAMEKSEDNADDYDFEVHIVYPLVNISPSKASEWTKSEKYFQSLKKATDIISDGYNEDYNDEDLGDATDHFNLISNRNFDFHEGPEHTGYSLKEPKDLLELKEEYGWMKKIPTEQWAETFNQKHNRDITGILKNRADNNMAPVITINGMLSDGYARTKLAHALGEKVLVAEFKAKKRTNFNKSQSLNKANYFSSLLLNSELNKGENGDWEKEGYTLSNATLKNHMTGYDEHQIYAHDKKGNKVANLYLHDEETHLVPSHVSTKPSHQRKGIASAMYEYAEKTYKKPIKANTVQSQEGKKLWNNPNRTFGKSEEIEKADKQRNLPVNPNREPQKPDIYFQQLTPMKGVSERGIEVRRADPRKTNATSAYTRVTTQQKHLESARQYFKYMKDSVSKQKILPLK